MGRPPRISRDQILDAARGAFSARGFAATTLADIARELDVTPAAILRHFDSKQELFSAAMSSRNIAVPDFVLALAKADPSADPRIVLGDLARHAIPFISAVLRPAIAVQMHATTVVVPFDTNDEEIPPRRALRLLTDYFERAMKVGTIRRGDARSLALLFIGQLQGYIFTHQVLHVVPVHPLDDYIEALLDLWSSGVLRGGIRGQKRDSRSDRPRRRGGGAAVPATAKKAEAARPRRNARSADGERGIAGRRTRRQRPHR